MIGVLYRALGAVSIFGIALAVPTIDVQPRATGSLDEWLEKQTPYALESVLANIGDDGSKVPGAGKGIPVASPSKSEPDCKFGPEIEIKVTILILL